MGVDVVYGGARGVLESGMFVWSTGTWLRVTKSCSRRVVEVVSQEIALK